MTTEQILKEIKARLEAAYGDRLRGVVLYGSEARGQADPDSDIGVLVLLDGQVTSWQDIKTSSDALYPLMLQSGRTIDAKPVDIEHYEKADAPLYINARQEGVMV